MNKITAIYVRVSTKQQKTASQEADLERWVNAQDLDGQVKWYRDKFTGKSMDRPAWINLQASIDKGDIDKLVVWRLDRLGRTASGLCKLFEDLQAKKVRLISLKDAIDLGTPSGRLMANMLASIAAYETEIRGERVMAGQAAARATGKKWGGAKKGARTKITEEQIQQIIRLKSEGQGASAISRATGVSRRHVYNIFNSI